MMVDEQCPNILLDDSTSARGFEVNRGYNGVKVWQRKDQEVEIKYLALCIMRYLF